MFTNPSLQDRPTNHCIDRDCEDSSAGNSVLNGLVIRYPKNLKPTAQANPLKVNNMQDKFMFVNGVEHWLMRSRLQTAPDFTGAAL